MKRDLKNIRRLIFAICAAIFIYTNTAQAATFTVNQAGDAGDLTCDATCTLRDAIDDANNLAGDDVINFTAGLTTVTLSNTEITIANNGSLTINGLGANVLTINGGAGTNRIFFTNQNAVVTITDVTLTGGNGRGNDIFPQNLDGAGGAILVNQGSLTLDRVHVTGNSSTARNGGGVECFVCTFRIRNSTFSNNIANVNSGGGFHTVSGAITIVNSTFSGNTADDQGGGFVIENGTLRNVTITGNTAGSTGGGFTNAGSLNMGNTIVAGNTALNRPEISNTTTTFTSAGNNLVGDSTGDAANTGNPITYNTAAGTADILDTPPQLGALQNNGGTTPTHALLAGSAAIDKGDNAKAVDPFDGSTLATDQRGSTRIVDYPPTGTAIVDIGAFELTAPTAASVSIGGRVMTADGRGIPKAFVSITDAGGNSRTVLTNPRGYYRFTEVAAGETYIITVSAKRYTFQNPAQVLNVVDQLNDVNFIATP